MSDLYACRLNYPNNVCTATPTYPAKQCTSYVANICSQYMQKPFPTGLGNAQSWALGLYSLGWLRGPAKVQTIYWLGPNVNGASSKGHVAWVVAVQGDNVLVQDYDWIPYAFDQHLMPIAGAQFIYPPIGPPQEDDDLTPLQSQQLGQIWAAIFEPTDVGNPTPGYPNYAPGNNLDIIRRKLSPYNEGYPPADSTPPAVAPK